MTAPCWPFTNQQLTSLRATKGFIMTSVCDQAFATQSEVDLNWHSGVMGTPPSVCSVDFYFQCRYSALPYLSLHWREYKPGAHVWTICICHHLVLHQWPFFGHRIGIGNRKFGVDTLCVLKTAIPLPYQCENWPENAPSRWSTVIQLNSECFLHQYWDSHHLPAPLTMWIQSVCKFFLTVMAFWSV